MADQYELSADLGDLTPRQYISLASHACLRLAWPHVLVNDHEVTADIPGGMSSFGEKLSVTVENGRALIQSRCAQKQLVDWGKNKKNVHQLVDMMGRLRDEFTPDLLDTPLVLEEQDKDLEEAKALQQRMESGTLTASDKLALGHGGLWVTYGLIAINVLVFIAMVASGVGIMDPTVEELINWGGNLRAMTANGEWWRLITSTFVHIGIIHLALNMYALLSLGMYLEPIMGRWKFLAAYMSTGLLASATSTWWHDNTVSAGASGAVFGIAGVWLALLTTNFIDKKMRGGLLQSMAIFVGYNLLYGLKGGVDNAAHIGGLVSGFLFGYLYLMMQRNERQIRFYPVAAIAAAIIVSMLVLDKLKGQPVASNNVLQQMAELEEKAETPFLNDTTMTAAQFIQQAQSISLPAYRELVELANELDPATLKNGEESANLLKQYFNQRVLYTEARIALAKQESAENSARADSLSNELNKTLEAMDSLSK